MVSAGIKPEMLRWARKRAHLSIQQAQDALGKKKWKDKLAGWEDGVGSPTFEQARALASVYRAPLGFLFLASPPPDETEVPDLRTIRNRRREISPDLRDVVMDAERKQEWLRQHRRRMELGKIAFVGANSLEDTPERVAQRLRRAIGVTREQRTKCGDWMAYLRLLVRLSEEAGVIVLRSSLVGNNTTRPLDVDDFRGFALADSIAPLVFVNTADIPPAQIFTLIHELAHLAINTSGISNVPVDEGPGGLQAEEVFCNAVAAEFLVPTAEFTTMWDDTRDLVSNTAALSRHFKVSRLVIARRAFERGYVGRHDYWPFVRKCIASAQTRRRDQKEKEGGPDYFVLVKARNGEHFTKTVARAAIAGKVLYRDAARLLGVRPKYIERLARNGGSAG